MSVRSVNSCSATRSMSTAGKLVAMPRWGRVALTFVVLFGACLAIVLDQGRATPFDYSGVRADAEVGEVVPELGTEDPHHYLQIGHDIAEAGDIPGSARRTLNQWPPGMHLYYASLFSMFGSTMPVGVVAGISMALLWAIVLTAYVDLLLRFLHWLVVGAVVSFVLLSELAGNWMLGLGLFWSEGLYTVLVLAAFYAAARAVLAATSRARLAWSGAFGGLIGISAYVRVVSELLGWLMLALLLVWGALTLIRRWRERRRAAAATDADGDTPAAASPRADWHQQLLALAVCVLMFQAVTIPWRLYAERKLHPGNYGWTKATNNVWHDLWTPDDVMRERGQIWLLEGRANSACKVDPDRCREIARYERRQLVPYSGWGRYSELDYRRLAFQTIREHPVAYGSDRLYYFVQAWFWSPENRTPRGAPEHVPDRRGRRRALAVVPPPAAVRARPDRPPVPRPPRRVARAVRDAALRGPLLRHRQAAGGDGSGDPGRDRPRAARPPAHRASRQRKRHHRTGRDRPSRSPTRRRLTSWRSDR